MVAAAAVSIVQGVHDSGSCWQASSTTLLPPLDAEADNKIVFRRKTSSERESDCKPSMPQQQQQTNSFSIRRYVSAVRSNDIRKNWPFCQKYLQIFLDNGRVPFLPPLEIPTSAENSAKDKEEEEEEDEAWLRAGNVARSRGTDDFGSSEEMSNNNKNSSTSGPQQHHPHNRKVKKKQLRARNGSTSNGDPDSSLPSENQEQEQEKRAKNENGLAEPTPAAASKTRPPKMHSPENKISRKTHAKGEHRSPNQREEKKSGSNGSGSSSIVCPVCRAFSSSSNTALNAHIDHCLSAKPDDETAQTENAVAAAAGAPAAAAAAEEEDENEDNYICRRFIRHAKPKPRKKRSISDIFACALMRTLEQDACDGACLPQQFSHQHAEAQPLEKRMSIEPTGGSGVPWGKMSIEPMGGGAPRGRMSIECPGEDGLYGALRGRMSSESPGGGDDAPCRALTGRISIESLGGGDDGPCGASMGRMSIQSPGGGGGGDDGGPCGAHAGRMSIETPGDGPCGAPLGRMSIESPCDAEAEGVLHAQTDPDLHVSVLPCLELEKWLPFNNVKKRPRSRRSRRRMSESSGGNSRAFCRGAGGVLFHLLSSDTSVVSCFQGKNKNLPPSTASCNCCEDKSCSSNLDLVSTPSFRPDQEEHKIPRYEEEKSDTKITNCSLSIKDGTEPATMSRSTRACVGGPGAGSKQSKDPSSSSYAYSRRSKRKTRSRKRRFKKKLVSLSLVGFNNSHENEKGLQQRQQQEEDSSIAAALVKTDPAGAKYHVAVETVSCKWNSSSNNNRGKRTKILGEFTQDQDIMEQQQQKQHAAKRMRKLSTLSTCANEQLPGGGGRYGPRSKDKLKISSDADEIIGNAKFLKSLNLNSSSNNSNNNNDHALSNRVDDSQKTAPIVGQSSASTTTAIRQLSSEQSFLPTSPRASGSPSFLKSATEELPTLNVSSNARRANLGRKASKYRRRKRRKNVALRKMKKVEHIVEGLRRDEECAVLIPDSGSNSNQSYCRRKKLYAVKEVCSIRGESEAPLLENIQQVTSLEVFADQNETATTTVIIGRQPILSVSPDCDRAGSVYVDEKEMFQRTTLKNNSDATSNSLEIPKNHTFQPSHLPENQMNDVEGKGKRSALDSTFQQVASLKRAPSQTGPVQMDMSFFDSSYGSNLTYDSLIKSSNSVHVNQNIKSSSLLHSGASESCETAVMVSDSVRVSPGSDDFSFHDKSAVSSDLAIERPSLIKLIEDLPAIPQDFECLEISPDKQFTPALFVSASVDDASVTTERTLQQDNANFATEHHYTLGKILVSSGAPLIPKASVNSEVIGHPYLANSGDNASDVLHSSAAAPTTTDSGFPNHSNGPEKSKTSQEYKYRNKRSEHLSSETLNDPCFENQIVESLPHMSKFRNNQRIFCDYDAPPYLLESMARQRCPLQTCSLNNVNCERQPGPGVLHLFGNPILRLMGKNVMVSSKDDFQLTQMECREGINKDGHSSILHAQENFMASNCSTVIEQPESLNMEKGKETEEILEDGIFSKIKSATANEHNEHDIGFCCLPCQSSAPSKGSGSSPGASMLILPSQIPGSSSGGSMLIPPSGVLGSSSLRASILIPGGVPGGSVNEQKPNQKYHLQFQRSKTNDQLPPPVAATAVSSQNGICQWFPGLARLPHVSLATDPAEFIKTNTSSTTFSVPNYQTKSVPPYLASNKPAPPPPLQSPSPSPSQSQDYLSSSSPGNTSVFESSQNFDHSLNKGVAMACNSPLLCNMDMLIDLRKVGIDHCGIP